MAADHAVAEGGIYIYRGGRAPRDVTNVRIHKSIFAIDDEAFLNCRQLEYVECHKELIKVGKHSFDGCWSLRGIELPGVTIIEDWAFFNCAAMTDADLPEAERIGGHAFNHCTSLREITAPSAESIGGGAFSDCECLISAEFGERLQTIGRLAFYDCPSLRRIAIPLPLRGRDNMFSEQVFGKCPHLSTVELVGNINNSVSYITMAIWRNQMSQTISQIKVELPTTHADAKTMAITRWMEEVQDRIIHFKILHSMWLTRATTNLELALWKVKLEEVEEEDSLAAKIKKAKINEDGSIMLSTAAARREYRQEKRIKCGADIIIKNVLPFLKLSRSDNTF
jgi:hypothetical protein